MNPESNLLPCVGPPVWPGVRNRRLPKPAAQRPGRTNPSAQIGLRTVALFEAFKGGIVLAAGLGVLELLGRDAQAGAEALVRHFHFNPASHHPRIFQLMAQQATPAHLWALAAGALVYAVVRFIEAYGLWRGRTWAEWFAVLSGGIYLPLEVWQVIRRATWASATVLTVNLAIVGYL
ncbi:MAG: DUF2127 domain-containing protein, partial [Verrucomicrobia bacterium]|nr:DUF2127 domain-containing protein [Verrucomicrobiota bacterium]